MVVLWILLFIFAFVAPCALSVWVGTRVRWPVVAFFLAWFTNPFVSFALFLIFEVVGHAITERHSDGTAVIVAPFYGLASGLIAGIVAAVIVDRRRQKLAVQSDGATQPQVSETQPK